MSLARRFDIKKPWAPIVAVAIVLTSVTIAFLLLRDTSAAISETPPAAGPSYQAADMPVPSDPAVAEQTPAVQTLADQTPREAAAPHQNPDDPTADQISANDISANEQSILPSRKALETVDPREFLRQANMPK